MPAPSDIRVAAHRGPAGLRALEQEWSTLYAALRPRHFFQRFDWQRCQLEHLHAAPEEVLYVVLSDADGVLAIVPLEIARRTRFGIAVRELRFPAHAHAPLRDMLCGSSRSMHTASRALIDYLRRSLGARWDILALQPVFPDSCTMRLFASERQRGYLREHVADCDFLPLDDVEGLHGRLSRNFRSNLSRARNKLAAAGDVSLECVRGGPSMAAAFEAFMEVEASGWKGAQGTGSAIKLDETLTGFYACLAGCGADGDGCEVALLGVNGRAIAAQLAFRVDATVYQLKIGYDEAHASLAPGNMLLERLIGRYAREGVARLHLVSDADWHRNWRADRHGLFAVYACALTPRGVIVFALLRLRRLLRPAYHALRRAFGAA